MKKIITISIMILSFFNCKSQSPIFPLDDLGWKNETNAYYKDLNNELNNFEGAWLYTNGNTSFKIILVKQEMFFNGNYYEDMIIGEFQYIENGIEKINTLANIANTNIDSHTISGNTILDDNCYYLPASDCMSDEKRLSISLLEPISNFHRGILILHKRIINGQEALRAKLVFDYAGPSYENVPTPAPILPWQTEYLLIKQ